MDEIEIDPAFARRFAECLRDIGWDQFSQTELGRRLSVSQGMAGRYLAGKAKPKGKKLDAILELFGVNQEWLCRGIGPKKRGAKPDDLLDMSGLTSEQKAILQATRNSFRKLRASNGD